MKGFIAYLDTRVEEGRAEIAALTAEGRNDDANFAKVRTNIYDVCRTVSRTLMDRSGAGVNAIAAQLERFRTSWSASLEEANKHDDISAAAVEETKLAALRDVIARFREVKA